MRPMIVLATVLLSLSGNAVAQTRSLNVGDAVISYELTGRGRTVVFIHGWTHNKSVWDDQVPVFSKRYRVLRYDSPGFGSSTGFADRAPARCVCAPAPTPSQSRSRQYPRL